MISENDKNEMCRMRRLGFTPVSYTHLPPGRICQMPKLHYIGISAAFDPYAEAEPVSYCPECGAPIYDGERIYYGHGTDHVIGCEHCIDTGFAQAG